MQFTIFPGFIILNIQELIAKVSNGHPPQPLPSREGLIYQPSPLVGEGKGEGVMDFCKSLIDYLFQKFLKETLW